MLEKAQKTNPIRQLGIAAILEILGDVTAFWPFDEVTGTTVSDFSLNGHDLTPSKDVSTWDTPPQLVGNVNVYDFDGTDEELDIADHADFSTTGAFSVGAWVKMTDATSNVILSKWDETTGSELREWRLILDGSDRPAFELYDESEDATVGRRDGTALSEDTWHFVVGTFSGGTDAANASVYVDGLAVDDADTADDAGFADCEDLAVVTAVGYFEFTDGGKVYFFDGKMWGPFYTKKELSADEVWNLYQIGKGLLDI